YVGRVVLSSFSFHVFCYFCLFPSFPTRRSSDLVIALCITFYVTIKYASEICGFVFKYIPHEALIGLSAGLVVMLAFMDAGFLNIDRKSTRLNSSHVSISYAVFCLKKKKET